MPPARVRAVMAREPPVDDALWREAAELGWFGLALPEDAGGAGYGLPEAMLLFEELGRALVPGPWLGTVLAARALGGDAGARDALGDVLAGRRRVAVVDDPGGPRSVRARRSTATAPRVARRRPAPMRFLVLGATAVRSWMRDARRRPRSTARPSMDPTRRLGTRRRSRGVARRPLDGDAAALAAEGDRARRGRGASASRSATLEMSVEYAKVRQQFGKPIGTFQAIKHRCADMAVRAEVARVGRRPTRRSRVRRRRARRRLPRRACAKALAADAAIAERHRQRPEPRRHGLHLGVGRAPVPEARAAARALLRHADGAPRRARGAVARGGLRRRRCSAARRASRRSAIADFRRYVLGQGVSLVGFWMQSVAQGWLVYRLSGSELALGAVAFVAYLPVLCLSPVAGVVADRVDKWRLIMRHADARRCCWRSRSGALVVTRPGRPCPLVGGAARALLGIVGRVRPADAAVVHGRDGRRRTICRARSRSTRPSSTRRASSARPIAGILVATVGRGAVLLPERRELPGRAVGARRACGCGRRRRAVARHGGRGLRSGLRYVRRQPAQAALLLALGLVSALGAPGERPHAVAGAAHLRPRRRPATGCC